MIRLLYNSAHDNKLKGLLIVLLIISINSLSQGVNFAHYNVIVSDTMFTINETGIKEVFYSSKKKIKKKKGVTNSIKYYKNRRLVYLKKNTDSYFEEFYYKYNESGMLISEYEYHLGKSLNAFTLYYYDNLHKLKSSIKTTDDKIFKVIFSYNEDNKIIEENLYVNNKWHYFKNSYFYEIASGFVKKTSMVTDTSSNFKKNDTLGIEYIDTKQNSSIYISKSKDFSMLTYKNFTKNGMINTKNSQVIEGENTLYSDYIEYEYIDNKSIFLIEKILDEKGSTGYIYFYKIPFSDLVQP
jgi:hypothetical protein